jgi:hypothetical protein
MQQVTIVERRIVEWVVKGDRQGVTSRWASWKAWPPVPISLGHFIVGGRFSRLFYSVRMLYVPPLVLVHAKRSVIGSVTFWWGSGSGSPDLYLLLMDPNPVFDVKAANKYYFFSYFFIYCPQAHHLQFKKINF